MKKLTCILLSVALLCLCGCTPKQDDAQKKDVFNDAFFADVIEIRDSRFGDVSKDQMGPVVTYLKSLAWTETDKHLTTVNENGQILYGPDLITFVKSDGTELTFIRNHATMTQSGALCSYVIEEGNLNAGLEEAYRQARSDSGN